MNQSTILIIINEGPYGNEKAYNALRIAMQIVKDHPDVKLQLFLMGDAVSCAVKNQITADGFYNIERMLQFCISKGVEVKICGSCSKARGLQSMQLIEGAIISNMPELTVWVVSADKILNF